MAVDGFLNIVKPQGMTSHDLVNWARYITGEKKIGHTGTLDPAAAGVLPLAVGRATRVIEYLQTDKSYRGEIVLGMTSNTDDRTGKTTSRQGAGVEEKKRLGETLAGFVGSILQKPPQFSAVKKHGVPAYRHARRGKKAKLEPRMVDIFRLELIEVRQMGRYLFATIDVDCSAGTYIRSLARDLGAALGCGGCLSFLLRKKAGWFRLDSAFSIEEVEESLQEGGKNALIPIDWPLQHLNRLTLDKCDVGKLIRGQFLPWQEKMPKKEEPVLVYDPIGSLVGVATVQAMQGSLHLRPLKVLVS